MRLQGKVAVITGAGSGMGRAMASLFSAEGARIVAGDWVAEGLDEVIASVKKAGGEILGLQGDIADRETAESLVNMAIENFGRLDILCNNAGIMDHNQGVGELSDDMWRRIMGINLDGPMFASRKAVPIMIGQGGGSIINTASVAGVSGAAAGAAYTAAKHGLVGLTRSTAWMYAKKGIRCNSIIAGATQTNIGKSMDKARLSSEGSERTGLYVSCVPAFLEPMDIAYLALFLASDESRHINGANIPADAGWTAA